MRSPLDKPAHPLPGESPALPAAPQRAVPQSAHVKPERAQGWPVHRHPVVPRVPSYDHPQPRAHHGDRYVQASPKLGFDLAQLRLQPPPDRLPHHREPPIPLLPADMREAEQGERLRLPPAGPLPVRGRIRAEFPQAGLLGVQLQTELCEPLMQLSQEPLGLRPVLTPRDDIVGKPDDHHVAGGLPLPPRWVPRSKV